MLRLTALTTLAIAATLSACSGDVDILGTPDVADVAEPTVTGAAPTGDVPFIEASDQCLVGDWTLDVVAFGAELAARADYIDAESVSVEGGVAMSLSADGRVGLQIDGYKEVSDYDFFALEVTSRGDATGIWGSDGSLLNAAWDDLDFETTSATNVFDSSSEIPPPFILPGRAGPYGCESDAFSSTQPGVGGTPDMTVTWRRA